MPATATCATCVHFSAVATECRKNPPALVPLGLDQKGNMRAMGVFAPTLKTNWCGAHEAAPPQPEETTS